MFLFSISLFASPKKICSYQLDTDKATVEATGYKFTEKLAVAGQFTGFSVNKNELQAKALDLLQGLVVTVDLLTLDSGNSLRNKNMRETLFANIIGDSKAIVTVKVVKEKTLETELSLNDKVMPVSFDYTISKGLIQATGVVDLAKFAMGEQITALRKRCSSLHTGADGKSVTWTDFTLKVTAPLKQTCQ